MTKKFFQTHKVYLTPISPIHIGAGEDYEPTNYVLEGDTLYVFDPAGPRLSPELRQELLVRINSLNFGSINQFFKEHIELFKPYSKAVIPVDSQIKKSINRILKGDISGRACIQRTMHTTFMGFDCPYIPGSTIKGLMHSALLDYFNNDTPRLPGKGCELDELVFEGTMEKSPMSLVKVGDFMPTKHVKSRIQLARRKNKANLKSEDASMPLNFEIIEKGQYRAFVGEISVPCSFDEMATTKGIDCCPKNITDLFEKTQDMCFESYDNDNETIWDKNNADVADVWVTPLGELLDEFEGNPKFRSFLLRVGKNQGADAITLYPKEIKQIKNRKSSESTTFFSAQEENNKWKILDMPFGWVIAEIDPIGDNLPLKNFCEKINKDAKIFDYLKELDSIRKLRPNN